MLLEGGQDFSFKEGASLIPPGPGSGFQTRKQACVHCVWVRVHYVYAHVCTRVSGGMESEHPAFHLLFLIMPTPVFRQGMLSSLLFAPCLSLFSPPSPFFESVIFFWSCFHVYPSHQSVPTLICLPLMSSLLGHGSLFSGIPGLLWLSAGCSAWLSCPPGCIL